MKRVALLSIVAFIAITATQAFANPIKICSADGTECCIVFDDNSVSCWVVAAQ
jgi:hypothetical protein